MWLYWWFAACFSVPRPPATAKRPETDHPGRIPDPRCGAVFTGGRAQSDHPLLSRRKIERLDCSGGPAYIALRRRKLRILRPALWAGLTRFAAAPLPTKPEGGFAGAPLWPLATIGYSGPTPRFIPRWGWDSTWATGGPQTPSKGPTRWEQREGRPADAKRPPAAGYIVCSNGVASGCSWGPIPSLVRRSGGAIPSGSRRPAKISSLRSHFR